MRTHLPCAAALMAILAGCQAPTGFAGCRAVLAEQAAAWNRGDLDAFCATYRKSEHTVFAGPDRADVGWEAMAARYQSSYPDRGTMGRLAFSELTFMPLGGGTIAARGRWQLTRAADAPAGWFMLVLREDGGTWRIVLDYTNRDEPADASSSAATRSSGGNRHGLAAHDLPR